MWQYAGPGGPASPPPPTDAESAVRDLVQDFTTHFNTGCYEHCAEMFIPEGQLMLPHRDVIQGRRMIEHSLAELADGGYQDLRMETLRVDAAGDRAIETGRYTLSIRLASGRLISDRGNYVAFWRRLGAWRIAVHCLSSSVPRTWQDVPERQLRAVEPPEVISRDVQRPA